MAESIRKGNIDFSRGPVWKCIMAQGLPLMMAQLVQLLYNIVDRIYIGHMGDSSLALTGVGLCLPLITVIMAFTALFGVGGVPLFSMARGAGDGERAERVLGNSAALLMLSSVLLIIFSYVFCRPILFAFGASEASYVYARKYLWVYLLGTGFSMLSTGLNGYINAQGFPRTGMFSTLIGAVSNIILDPVFIFALDMGVAGAALATVISQAVSALWVLRFLTGEKAEVSLKRANIRLDRAITWDITRLGTSNFIMQATNFLVQVVCNSTLQRYGGDIYVGIMTAISSVREIFMLPMQGVISGSQPVISFNYGAKQYERVKQGIRFNTVLSVSYTLLAWLLVMALPRFWFDLFTDDMLMIEQGISALKIYFFGFVFIALQMAGQSSFQAMGDARHAIFFSLLRKAVIVAPLTVLLPMLGFGVKGVFLAEPVSDLLGGVACYTTMILTAYRKLGKQT